MPDNQESNGGKGQKPIKNRLRHDADGPNAYNACLFHILVPKTQEVPYIIQERTETEEEKGESGGRCVRLPTR